MVGDLLGYEAHGVPFFLTIRQEFSFQKWLIMEATMKKFQQKFKRVKDDMDRWDELHARLLSQFRNASSIIGSLQVKKRKNMNTYGLIWTDIDLNADSDVNYIVYKSAIVCFEAELEGLSVNFSKYQFYKIPVQQ